MEKRKRKRDRSEEGEDEVEGKCENGATIKGTMERGKIHAYRDLQRLDGPGEGSYMYWGCLWIEGVDISDATIAMHMHPARFSIVDHVDQRTLCVRMNVSGPPMIVNEGNAPCIRSVAEVLPPPHPYARWYHFQHGRNRDFVHGEVDWLYGLFPGCTIYLMMCMHPLKLIHIMDSKEVDALMKRYDDRMEKRNE